MAHGAVFNNNKNKLNLWLTAPKGATPVNTVCKDTFTLFWLRKTSVIVEKFQLTFCVFMYVFHLEVC